MGCCQSRQQQSVSVVREAQRTTPRPRRDLVLNKLTNKPCCGNPCGGTLDKQTCCLCLSLENSKTCYRCRMRHLEEAHRQAEDRSTQKTSNLLKDDNHQAHTITQEIRAEEEEEEEEECPICLESGVRRPYIFVCGHWVCREHMKGANKLTFCPICRGPATEEPEPQDDSASTDGHEHDRHHPPNTHNLPHVHQPIMRRSIYDRYWHDRESMMPIVYDLDGFGWREMNSSAIPSQPMLMEDSDDDDDSWGATHPSELATTNAFRRDDSRVSSDSSVGRLYTETVLEYGFDYFPPTY